MASAAPAGAADTLSGKQFYAGGAMITGTMTDQGTWDVRTSFPGAAVCQGASGGTGAIASQVSNGKYFWNSSGVSTVGTMADRGNLDEAASFPGAGYYGGTPTNVPSPTSICSGSTIMGVGGSATCGSSGGVVMGSNEFRDKATTQLTQTAEAVTNAGTVYTNADPGYRAIPKISKDDDGFVSAGTTSGQVMLVNRTGWSTTTCGTSGTIAARIADCAGAGKFGANATWDGATMSNSGYGQWKLVTRTGDITAASSSGKGREVWQDQRTGLLWSSIVSTLLNWCKASGSNNITGNPVAESDPSSYCTSATYQATTGSAVSACFEAAANFTTTDVAIDSLGKGGLGRTSTPVVGWRLPTINDYKQADVNGIRFVMPDNMAATGSFTYEWSASVSANLRGAAWLFYGSNGGLTNLFRNTNYFVRCVGR